MSRAVGYKHTEATKLKMSLKAKGRVISTDQRLYLSNLYKGIRRPQVTKNNTSSVGEKSHNWKGGVSKVEGYESWMKNKRNRDKRSNGGSHTFLEWEELKRKYKYTCPSCKKKEPEIKLTEDHIVPVSKGGGDDIGNIQPLCKSCNIKKLNKTIKYEFSG